MFDLEKFLTTFFTDKPAPKDDWERVYKGMIVHTRGVKPTDLLNIKRPNEPDDLRAYRLANYRAITKHGINQAIDSVYRVLSSSNYSIVYAKNISEYLETTKFSFLEQRQDFHTLFFNSVLRLMFDDPNGLLVWMPENSNPLLAPIENEQTTPINVVLVYVNSCDIKHLSEDVAAFKGGEMMVTVPWSGNKTKEEPHPFYFICTHDFIYRYIPIYSTEKKKVVWIIEDWYSLAMTDGQPDKSKEFPSTIWHQLGGNIAMNEKGLRYYDSFYGCYLPFGDDCICAYSDNQAVRVRYNFPFVTIKGQKCETCKGAKKVNDKEGKAVICSACGGKGVSTPFSPFGYYVAEPPATSDSEAFTALPFVDFKNPDVAILQHSFETWENLLEKAKNTVNLTYIDEAQSGVAKEIDREQKYETLIKITQNFFGLIRWSLEIIQAYKVPFKDGRQESKVTEPESFSIKTESQLMAELNEMTLKETPQAFISTTSKQIADKIYSNDEEAKIIVNILSKWDVLYGMSANSISLNKANGGANQRDVLRHVQGYSILSKLAMELDLTNMKPIEIIEKAEEMLNELMPQEQIVMEEPPAEEMQPEQMPMNENAPADN